MIYAGHKDLVVWQKAKQCAVDVYKLTESFPKEEMYGLISQMRRAAVSIPSNIAEGSRRKGDDEKRFFRMAFASGAELETQIEIAKDLGFGKQGLYTVVEETLDEVMKMLNKLSQ